MRRIKNRADRAPRHGATVFHFCKDGAAKERLPATPLDHFDDVRRRGRHFQRLLFSRQTQPLGHPDLELVCCAESVRIKARKIGIAEAHIIFPNFPVELAAV